MKFESVLVISALAVSIAAMEGKKTNYDLDKNDNLFKPSDWSKR